MATMVIGFIDIEEVVRPPKSVVPFSCRWDIEALWSDKLKIFLFFPPSVQKSRDKKGGSTAQNLLGQLVEKKMLKHLSSSNTINTLFDKHV